MPPEPITFEDWYQELKDLNPKLLRERDMTEMRITQKREQLAKRIRNILLKHCPALEYKWNKMNNRKFIWFEARCLARKVTGEHGKVCKPCVCIQKLTDNCPFGIWPQLGFVMNEVRDVLKKESKEDFEEDQWRKKLEPEILIPKIQAAMKVEK